MTYQVFIAGEWIEGQPTNGQRYRMTDAGGGLVESIYSDDVAEETDLSAHIDIDAFFDRFGAVRWALLGSSDSEVRAFIEDVKGRPFVILTRPDVSMGMDQLIAKGLPGVDIALKENVLRTPVAHSEQRILKRLYF